MGKSSKSKSRKTAKQERAKHFINVELYEKTLSTFMEKFYNTSLGRHERIELLMRQIQLTLKVEESYAFINRHRVYREKLTGLCPLLLFDLIRSKNYLQASIFYNDMMKYSFAIDLQSELKPFSNLFLLWIEGDNVDKEEERQDAFDNITQDFIDIIRRPGAKRTSQFLFLQEALIELTRCSDRRFATVEYLSLLMLQNFSGEFEFTNQWKAIDRTFLVYSFIDRLRFSKVDDQAFLSIVRKIQLLPYTAYLANSILDFYSFFYRKEEQSSESATESECIKSLEMHVALKSEILHCHTCREEDTPNHESFVCQGCRVVSYCCKDHQRYSYFHHEETGTRGLGHKYLCPVFKAYRKKKENTDISKQGDLERKFQRACKRFLRGTFQERTQNV